MELPLSSRSESCCGGLVPGLLLMVYYMATIAVTVRKSDTRARGEKFTLKERIASLKGIAAILMLFVVVIGGIFGGFFTANEELRSERSEHFCSWSAEGSVRSKP